MFQDIVVHFLKLKISSPNMVSLRHLDPYILNIKYIKPSLIKEDRNFIISQNLWISKINNFFPYITTLIFLESFFFVT